MKQRELILDAPLGLHGAVPDIVQIARSTQQAIALAERERLARLKRRHRLGPPSVDQLLASGAELAPNGLPYDFERNPRPLCLRVAGRAIFVQQAAPDQSWAEQFPQCFDAQGAPLNPGNPPAAAQDNAARPERKPTDCFPGSPLVENQPPDSVCMKAAGPAPAASTPTAPRRPQ